MPTHYLFVCTQCGWQAIRYRTTRRCPKCRHDLVRVAAVPAQLNPAERRASVIRSDRSRR